MSPALPSAFSTDRLRVKVAVVRAPRTTVALIGAAFILLISAWIMATTPFGAPDEASHYLRALTITQGRLLGPRIHYPTQPGMTPQQAAFVQGDSGP
jgi:hypothetical protein